MYSEWINYVYEMISNASSGVGSISYGAVSLISSKLPKIINNYPAIEDSNIDPSISTINTKQIGDIQSVIHDYKRLNTTYQANKKIIHSDNKYIEELTENITYLVDLNKELNDEYIERWAYVLEQRKRVLCDDLNVLNNSKKTFNKFSVTEDTHNLDTLTICSVCMENKKDRSIDCGHIFCSTCLKKLTNCPTCRIDIDIDKIRHIFI